MANPDLLQQIVTQRRKQNAIARQACTDEELKTQVQQAPPVRGFEAALRATAKTGRPAVIAELKRASPSRGLLCQDYAIERIARQYQQAGASALSVLTEADFFQGGMHHLHRARAEVQIPVLCKDFMVESRQFYEARLAGADCVLLIAAVLDDARLHKFKDLAQALQMDVLVEIHNREELTRALALETGLIGINNRNLKTFATHIEVTLDLLADIPGNRFVVTESGIAEPRQVRLLRERGVPAFLVGESLIRAPDPGAQLQQLFFPDAES